MIGGSYARILDETLQESCRSRRDAALSFFRLPNETEKPPRAQKFHRWIVGRVDEASDPEAIRETAKRVTDEFVETPLRLMRELITGTVDMLPKPPLWRDDAPLYSPFDGRTNRHRFEVVGGNQATSTGEVARDLRRAYGRLVMVNMKRPFAKDEPLIVYCAESCVGEFERAQRVVKFRYRVITNPLLRASDPWCLSLPRPVAGFKLDKPEIEPDLPEGTMICGALFSIWIEDPAACVRMADAA